MFIVVTHGLSLTSHHSKQCDKREGIIRMCSIVLLCISKRRVQTVLAPRMKKHSAWTWFSKAQCFNLLFKSTVLEPDVQKHSAWTWCSKAQCLNLLFKSTVLEPDVQKTGHWPTLIFYRIWLLTFCKKYFILLRQIIEDCFTHPR
jgi:hypothetical protein